MKRFIIVKYASDAAYHFHFDTDPKVGCDISYSAHDTYTGKEVGLQKVYTEDEYDLCVTHNHIINNINPSGYYDICVVLES